MLEICAHPPQARPVLRIPILDEQGTARISLEVVFAT
jgi:hypothetical protein